MIAPALVKVVEVPIDDLRPDPANPRRISDAQIEALTRSLKEFGFVQPVLVCDLFLGSGSTLIAAERTGRICYGSEIDPHYASVVLARWEAFTGSVAERLDS